MKSVVLALAGLSLLAGQAGASRGAPDAAAHPADDAAVASAASLPAETWEARSKGATVMGDATVAPTRIVFAHAGAAVVTPHDGYVTLRWETPSRAEIPLCVGGELPQTAQLAVREQEGRRVLEIAFFRGTAKPAADRDADAMLCQIQYWAEAGVSEQLVLAGGKGFPYLADMIHSRLTSKAQTTIPRAVRTALGLKEGDRVAYEIEGDRVILTRADAVDDPFATFTEWASAADAEAYAKL